MAVAELDARTALVLVDLQKGIVGMPTVHAMDGVVKNARALAAAFRRRGLPVVLVNVAGGAPGRAEQTRGLGALPDGWTDLVPELDRQPSDHVVTKRTWGAFLANAVPHFVSGVMGRPFQSPFAKPRGQGLSSSTVNVLWGFLNSAVGYALVCRVGHFDLRSTDHVVALGSGVLLMGMITARLFGRFHGGNSPGGS